MVILKCSRYCILGSQDQARHLQVRSDVPRTASWPGQLQAVGKGKGDYDLMHSPLRIAPTWPSCQGLDGMGRNIN